VLNFLNGGYLCNSSNFVFDLAFTGTPPFTFTYSLDGVAQPPVTADMSPFFHLVTEPWSDSIKLLSVHSGPCIGQLTGAFDYVKIVEPVSASTPIINCNQTNQTYTFSLDLSGGVFGYISGGTTPGFVSGNQFFSSPQPFDQDYDVIIWSGLMCDSVFLTGPSGCIVNCPVDFGTISPDTLICDGADISLQASGGLSYAWEGPDNFMSSLQNPVITGASPINWGVYSVTITDNNNCKDTLSTLVGIHVVNGFVTGDTPVCAGEDIELTATGGLTYLWSGPDNFSSISGNPVLPMASALSDGRYFVTITDDENCSATYYVDIVVNPLPIVSVMGNDPICEGDTLLLATNGGNTYNWTGPAGFNSNLQNPFIVDVDITNAGMYFVTATDINNCMGSASLSINILDGPEVMIMTNTPLCSGSDILFQGSGADSYAWTGPNGFTSALPDPVIAASDLADSGPYTLIGTNTNGCRDSITTNIDVLPLPVVMATADQAEYCEEETILLSVNSGTSYSWSGPDGFTSNLQSPSIINSTLAQQGTYIVQMSDVNGCTNQGQVSILVISSPTVTIAGDVSICEGSSVLLTAQGDGTTYNWSGPAGVMSSGMIISVPDATLINSGTYYLVSGNAQNCFSTDSVEVLVQVNPVAGITGPDSICAGEEVNLIASGGQDYDWNSGETGASLSDFPPVTTAYEVVVTQGECNDTATWIVLVNPLPEITIGGAGTIAPGEAIMLVASGADQYTWGPGAGLDCTTCPDPTAMPDTTTTYCVTGLLNGCEATECAVVMVVVNCDFALPNVFSPNFDSINDYWCSPKPDCVSEQHLTVFDRWGNALFDQRGEDVCWDGTAQQKEVSPGVYVYRLELQLSATETRIVTGDIMVIR
jgi:gliding motility-associated-like protein